MLPVAPECDACGALKRARDGWMRPPRRAVVNILLPQFAEFISAMRQFTLECRLRSISTGCRCNGGGHAHVQGRAASKDTSGSEDRPAWICEAVSLLGSVVMPGSASFMPQTTA